MVLILNVIGGIYSLNNFWPPNQAIQTIWMIVKEFFTSGYYDPWGNMVAAGGFCVLLIAAVAGSAWLIKKVYDKHYAVKLPP